MKSVIRPRTTTQTAFVTALRAVKPWILVANGPAGAGKTLLATSVGVEQLLSGQKERMIITRPTVPADEDIGYLPGTLEQKMDPWLRPVSDALAMHLPPKRIKSMFDDGVIEVAPLMYMRGRTFKNAWIVCDEAQNCTPNQLLMLMSRLGDDSKMVITGDTSQHDRRGVSGLQDLILRLAGDQGARGSIEHVQFGEEDAVRHPVTPLVLRLYS